MTASQSWVHWTAIDRHFKVHTVTYSIDTRNQLQLLHATHTHTLGQNYITRECAKSKWNSNIKTRPNLRAHKVAILQHIILQTINSLTINCTLSLPRIQQEMDVASQSGLRHWLSRLWTVKKFQSFFLCTYTRPVSFSARYKNNSSFRQNVRIQMCQSGSQQLGSLILYTRAIVAH